MNGYFQLVRVEFYSKYQDQQFCDISAPAFSKVTFK